jgi:class 3 adenylate cyclase/TolB-like protein
LDEDETHRKLTEYLDGIAEQVQAHRGRVGHYAGDAVLADFASATDAVACASRIQGMFAERNAREPAERRLQFRIGINLGEVIDDRGEVYGEGVNVAARLEALAEPGGICVSDGVRTAVGNRLPIAFEDMGIHEVRSIPMPVRAWQVHEPLRSAADSTSFVLRAEVRAHCVLMGEGERAIRNALDRSRLAVTEEIEGQGGAVLHIPGEAIVAEFQDARACLACAETVRAVVERQNATLPPSERVHYRYGVDVGAGDAASAGTSALCASASPNEIRFTGSVRRLLENEDGLAFSAVAADTYALYPAQQGEKKPDAIPQQVVSLDLPLPEKPSILLLPFTFIGNESSGESLAEGLRLDIQNALVKMSGLFLIAAGAANAFRGADAIEAARTLGVRHVLEGTVRLAGDRARVNVQLTDSVSSVVSWAEQYDRQLDDDFALQDEITEHVVTALDVKLASGEQARVWRKCLSDSKARDSFYRGLHRFFQMSAESMAEAERHFERVVALAPESAMGPTWLAMCLWFEATRGWAADPAKARRQAGDWAEKCTGMEDVDGQANTVLGNVRLLEGRHQEAKRIARDAVVIRPGCTNANGFLANVLLHCGEPESALTHVKRAIRLSPVYPPWFLEILAASYREVGEAGLAVAAAGELLRLAPGSVQGRVILASSMVRAGLVAEARRVAAEIAAMDGRFSLSRFKELQVFQDGAVVDRLVENLRDAGLRD